MFEPKRRYGTKLKRMCGTGKGTYNGVKYKIGAIPAVPRLPELSDIVNEIGIDQLIKTVRSIFYHNEKPISKQAAENIVCQWSVGNPAGTCNPPTTEKGIRNRYSRLAMVLQYHHYGTTDYRIREMQRILGDRVIL